MQDIETETLWSQISGKGIQGPQTGTELVLYPSTITTFAEFKKLYPKGMLLAKPEKFQKGSHYETYFADSAKLGIFERIDNFKRLPGKTKVIGLRLETGNVAVAVDRLANDRVILIANAQPKVAIIYDSATETAFAYELAGLSIDRAADISVEGTSLIAGDASWDIRTGRQVEGEAGSLKPVPLITAFWFAWASFFPSSELIQ
jgi:hypothetical protein